MSTDEPPGTTRFDDAADAVAVPHEPTYPVNVGARALHKSEAWYLRQLKAGSLLGHRVGRRWFLTSADIAAAIEYSAPAPPRHRRGLPRRRRRSAGVAVGPILDPVMVCFTDWRGPREDRQPSACSLAGLVYVFTGANSGRAGVSWPCHHPTRGGNRSSAAVNR